MLPRFTSLSCVAVLLLVGAICTSSRSRADEAVFKKQIAPILEVHCIRCHGGRATEAELNLTTRAAAIKGGQSGTAVVPGKPDDSNLLFMVTGKKPEMPKNADPLSAEQIAALTKWIKNGAAWPKGLQLKERKGKTWWSFRQLSQPPIPSGNARVRTPIDAFVHAGHPERGLRFSPDADRRTLIRRLTYDLHGLPPTPRDVDAFINDTDPLAYEKLVDRLLASPRYGERWARHWLDVVHYGDTHGYDKDKRRPHAWPYRDWVIRALNADIAYRDFVRFQLAGDVLGHIPATGFIAAGPWDFVGHVELREGTLDKHITRNLDRDDMVTTAMSTFVSLTVHCARCHDHKFDPIAQREYYSLQAVFAGVERANRLYDPDPHAARARRRHRRELSQLNKRLAELERQIAKRAGPELARINARLALLSKPAGPKRPEYGYHSRIEAQQNTPKWVQVDLGKPTPLEQIVVVGCHDEFANIGAGFGFPMRYRIEASNDASFKTGVTTIVDKTTADAPNPGVAPQSFQVKEVTARYVRVTATKLAHRQRDYIFALAELLVVAADGKNVAAGRAVQSLDSIEAPTRWRRSNLTDGIWFGENKQNLGAITRLNERREAILRRALDAATRIERVSLRQRIASVKASLASLRTPQLVYAAAGDFKRQGNFTPPPNGKPRTIRVLHRGSIKSPGEVVFPAAVAALEGLSPLLTVENVNDESQRRLALANWIVDHSNPLTWRSIVNRVWQYHFGRGLVETPNDFGRMGGQPTHPQLLDWLAADFREHQSLKRLHRLIVTSTVYRQQSRSNATMATIDAGNRYLWRMHRRRLEAEAVRDAVLAVSGRMRSQMYGPGFDLFGFKDDHSPHYKYASHNPDDPASSRRTVYRFVVRSVPDPFMETLDCPDPSLIAPKRNTTITALQALALLNNRFMVRMAEHFAARIAAENNTLPGQVNAACETALSRRPDDELKLLTAYAQRHGLANLCRLLFNSNEFLFVD